MLGVREFKRSIVLTGKIVLRNAWNNAPWGIHTRQCHLVESACAETAVACGGWDVDIRNKKSPLNDAVNRRNSGDRVMVNNELEIHGRKRPWPDCHSILLERQRNAKNLSWWCMSCSGFEPNQQQSFALNKVQAAVRWCCTFKDFLILTKALLLAGCLAVVFSTNVILSL
jgi:hypothetical protein